MHFYPSAAAAELAGYRPCRRCLPEAAPRVPEWCIGSRLAVRGLRMVDAGLVEASGTRTLARRLGLEPRQLERLFHAEFGATPQRLAGSRRRALAKRLIEQTDLDMATVARHAGYGSLRWFNEDVRRAYRRSPSAMRARRRRRPDGGGGIVLHLPVRQPYDFEWVFEFLRRRALSGTETVSDGCYRRLLGAGVDGSGGTWISVTRDVDGLRLEIPPCTPVPIAQLLPRVRRVFDLDAEPRAIDGHLVTDPLLAEVIHSRPGVRVPGAWDGFETTVRAVLGQQVSVDRATRLAHRLLERFGPDSVLDPSRLAATNPSEIGMPRRRGEAIRRLAREVADGRLRLDETVCADELTEALRAIPGVGPWTAGYVSMRVARDPDALPINDWVVLKMLATDGSNGSEAVKAAAAGRAGSRSDAWRPWRAYATMYLWQRAQAARVRPAAVRRSATAGPAG